LPFILISIVGLGFLTGIDPVRAGLGIGAMAAIVSMLGYDFGALMSRVHPKHFSNRQNTIMLLLVSWIPLLVISLARGESQTLSHVTAVSLLGLVLSAIMNVVGLYVTNYVFANLKAYVAGNIFLLDGVFAALLGFFLYGEIPAPLALLGAGIIVACAYMISLIDMQANRLEAAPAPEAS
jgi:drug/metabolite transporter (DMT)-like permease